MRLIAFSISITVLSWTAVAQAQGNVAAGLLYAEAHCAQCHAVGEAGQSPYMPAPPFRTLYSRYPVENLAEALAEGIGVEHRGEVQMPEFVLSPQEIDNLLAYLAALEWGGDGAPATQ